MLFFAVFTALLAFTSAQWYCAVAQGDQDELEVFSPWKALFECRWAQSLSVCLEMKSGVLARATAVSSNCASCYTSLQAGIASACSGSLNADACVSSATPELATFAACAGFAMTTGSTSRPTWRLA